MECMYWIMFLSSVIPLNIKKKKIDCTKYVPRVVLFFPPYYCKRTHKEE